MVVLSSLICTKNAKIIFSRQFIKMSRMELEDHVVNFTRNIDLCNENTTFESDKARYIFIPTENLYLVLITEIDSNLIEDIEISKLIYRLIQDICGIISEELIVENAFDLLMGIDDIVNMGYKDAVLISQIKQNMLMDSQDEKEFRKIQEQRELVVKKQMQEKSKEFEKMRRENKFLTDSISRLVKKFLVLFMLLFSASFENNTIEIESKPGNSISDTINDSSNFIQNKNNEEIVYEEIPRNNTVKQGGMKLSKKKDDNRYN